MAENPPIDLAAPRASSIDRRSQQDNDSDNTDVEQTPSTLPKLDDEPPNGGYGWVCVACCFFINGQYPRFKRKQIQSGDQIWDF